MTKSPGLLVALAALALFAAAFALPGAPAVQGSPAQRRGLTPQERRGKMIYLRGESPSGREIEAAVSDVTVPATAVTCAGCHGPRGEGKTEAGVTAGALAWANLLKTHTHPTGRTHGTFDEASFARAVTGGVDPAGNRLAAAMPRFRMSPEDVADLVAYLRRIESEAEPGVSETAVRVGTVLPARGALAETGAAMREVLAAYFEDLNARGGVYGRRVELRVAEAGETAGETAAGARRLVEQEDVFAIVGGMSAGADAELAALAGETETPFVGPATLTPRAGAPVNRQVFYILPGLGEQARALVNLYAQRPGARTRAAVVYANSAVAALAAGAAEDQCAKAGCGTVQKVSYEVGRLDAAALVRGLKGADAVFFFGTAGDELALIREAAAAGWTPNVMLLGALASGDLASGVPAVFRDRVFVAFPTVPSDLTQAGLAELRALQEKYKIAPRHTASQLSAFAAARVFTEGLRRSGRDLSREKFINALEGLYDFETGLTPRLTFGPNRRVGAAGASIMKVDPEKREFTPAGGWVKAY
ncbi:MAG TPA: ABC transporter substrate-binding protein [Pyrinomonadaceae bacterium]|jgi:ABC-type branched-subunit amino acid transport system substrate-binding protein/cytochrome c553